MLSAGAANLLNALAVFPVERLVRCGATGAQITDMSVDWAARTTDWQAQESSWLATQPDPVWTASLTNWPPSVPTQSILFWSLLDSQWSYVAGMTDAYSDSYTDAYGVPGAVLTQTG